MGTLLSLALACSSGAPSDGGGATAGGGTAARGVTPSPTAPPLALTTGVVAGYVALKNSVPLTGATVAISDVAGKRVQSASNGFFELDGVPPGNHNLQVSSASAVTQTFPFTVAAGQLLNVNLEVQALTVEDWTRAPGPVPVAPIAPLGPVLTRVNPNLIGQLSPVVPTLATVRTVASPSP